jgi:integrase
MPDDFYANPNDIPNEKKARSTKWNAWHSAHVWTPHQLRHTAGTNIRKEYGAETASVILGNRIIPVAELYGEANIEEAARVVAEVG